MLLPLGIVVEPFNLAADCLIESSQQFNNFFIPKSLWRRRNHFRAFPGAQMKSLIPGLKIHARYSANIERNDLLTYFSL